MDLETAESGWDYNCPQYIDFSEPIPMDDDADKWFEHDHEDFEEENSLVDESKTNQELKEEKPKTPKLKAATPKVATPKAHVAPMRADGSTGPVTRHQAKMTPAGDSGPSNLFTSIEDWRAKKPKPMDSEKKVGIVAPLRNGKRTISTGSDVSPVFPTDSKKPALKRQKVSGSNLRKSGPQDGPGETKCRSLKRSNSTAGTKTAERVAKPHTRGYSAGRSGSLDVRKKEENDVPSAKIARIPTMPTTPTFMRRKQHAPGSPKVKSTEEQELEQIAYMRKELAKKRKMAMDSLKKSKTASGYVPVHSVKETTKPMEFQFSTDDRVKSQQQDAQEESCSDFARSLRSQTTTTVQAPRGLTKPQPFKLSVSHKVPSQTEKYQSMAQSVAAFHRATPDRFRRKPRTSSSDRKLLKARSPRQIRMTQPETPKLETRNRYRPITVPSQKEIEDQEYEEIKKYQFKAHPVNSKIMSHPTGLYKPDPKPATEPEEFNLHLEKRIKVRQANRTNDDDEFIFQAQPVPKKILEGTVGVKPAKEIPATIPKSPAFALKHRVRLPVEIPEDKEPEKSVLKAHTVPHPGIPFQPKLCHRKTITEPFSFERRYRDPNSVKEALRKQVLEEEQRAREFHANPLPSLEPVLPERHTKVCTKTEPFLLQSDVRGEKKTEEWNHKVVEEEIAKQKAAAIFKARPAEVLRQDPFVPERSNRPLTDVSDVTLNTEKRAVNRDDYELRKKAREAQLAEMGHEREVQKMEEERAAIAKLRSEMVHKPNPVRKFKPVVVCGSDKPPTFAESPQFSDRLRSKVRM